VAALLVLGVLFQRTLYALLFHRFAPLPVLRVFFLSALPSALLSAGLALVGLFLWRVGRPWVVRLLGEAD
jgi:hypothetical protein